MIQTKQTYDAPTAETLVVRFEGVICQSIPGNAINPLVYDDDELNG